MKRKLCMIWALCERQMEELGTGECLPHKPGNLSISHRSYFTIQEWWTMLLKPVLEEETRGFWDFAGQPA